MGRKIIAIAAALVMLSTVLAFTAAATTAEARGKEGTKVVETRDVDVAFTFTLADLADTELVQLVPPEVLEQVDPETQVAVRLDGKLHVNALVTDSGDAWDVSAHVAWHGVIALQIGDWPEMVFDLKNAQLKIDASVPADAEELDLKVNFHVNGQLNLYGTEPALDLSTHVLLKVHEGQLVSMKVWLPGVMEDLLLDM